MNQERTPSLSAIVRTVFVSSRPISWINTAFPFGVGYLISGGSIDLRLILGFLFFLIPYNVAMYGINDVYDYESDIRNPRKGGVEGAVLGREFHRPILWAAAVSVIPLSLVLLAMGTLASGLWLVFSLFLVLAYSFKGLRFKEKPVLDSLTSSGHFVTPALVGAAMAPTAPGISFYAACIAFFLWGAASHALGAVQDVKADNEAGISSIATACGARLTARLATFFYLAASLIVLTLPFPALIPGILSLGYVINAARWWNITDENCEDANKSWRVFLWLNYVTGAAVTISLVAAGVFNHLL